MYARAHWVKCRNLEVETSAHSPRSLGFCCPKIRFERVEDGKPALSNFAQVFHLLLREGGENLKWFEEREHTKLNFTDLYSQDIT